MTKDIHKADLLLDGLLNYFQVTTPIRKANTVNTLVEEVLKKNQVQLEEKGVRLFKKLEKDLPEIIVPDKPLRFILDTILQYAVTLIPPHETLGFLTQSFAPQEPWQGQTLLRKGERYVEIALFFKVCKKPVEPFGMEPGIEALHKEGGVDLILRLVKEAVHRNRGVMKFQGNEKEAKISISLVFPIERRTVFYYPNDN